MIDAAYAQTMARYNQWQNENLLSAADALSDAERQAGRGAFFGSIAATLSHLLWADRMWLSRFGRGEAPAGGIAESLSLAADWAGFRTERAALDRGLIAWAAELGDWLEGPELRWYSGAVGRELTRPRAVVVVHLFNHQTHHRGQIHAMLTAAGQRPGATDLPFMP